MTDLINKTLSDLVGLQLTGTTRAANMECLKFGTNYRKNKLGKTNQIGEFALHLQCPWRFTDENHIIIGSEDLYQPAEESAKNEEDYDSFQINSTLRDVALNNLIHDNKLIVNAAICDQFGGLEICFNNGIKLSVFPNVVGTSVLEYWRLINNRKEITKHLESWSNGYELEE